MVDPSFSPDESEDSDSEDDIFEEENAEETCDETCVEDLIGKKFLWCLFYERFPFLIRYELNWIEVSGPVL